MISVTIAFILFSPQDGDTALHYASRNGHLEVVKLLLQCHADVHVKGTVSSYIQNHLTSTIHSLSRKSGNFCNNNIIFIAD